MANRLRLDSVTRVPAVVIVVLAYVAAWALITLQNQWPGFRPPDVYNKAIGYALLATFVFGPWLGFSVATVRLVRRRRLVDSILAIVLDVPMLLLFAAAMARALRHP